MEITSERIDDIPVKLAGGSFPRQTLRDSGVAQTDGDCQMY